MLFGACWSCSESSLTLPLTFDLLCETDRPRIGNSKGSRSIHMRAPSGTCLLSTLRQLLLIRRTNGRTLSYFWSQCLSDFRWTTVKTILIVSSIDKPNSIIQLLQWRRLAANTGGPNASSGPTFKGCPTQILPVSALRRSYGSTSLSLLMIYTNAHPNATNYIIMLRYFASKNCGVYNP